MVARWMREVDSIVEEHDWYMDEDGNEQQIWAMRRSNYAEIVATLNRGKGKN